MSENSQRKQFQSNRQDFYPDWDPFLERLDSMNAHKESLEEGIKFRPDEKYPELSRNELIKHTILAICL